MNLFDPGAADAAVAKVLGALTALALTGLGIWARFYKTRKAVSVDNGERKRFEDAIEDASAARKEAHDVNNKMMDMQHRMGRLEAENEACLKTTNDQSLRITRLEKQNEDQAKQIERLIRRNKDTEVGGNT